jgi:hypothetical protein
VAELRGGASGGARRRGHRHIAEWWPVAAGAELGFRDRWQGVTPGGGGAIRMAAGGGAAVRRGGGSAASTVGDRRAGGGGLPGGGG